LAGIVAGCQQGDRQAQRLLYDHCHPRLYGLILRMVGHQDAPDLLQQVFLQMYVKIEQFAGRSGFETWIYRLAINECLQFRRRHARANCAMPADEPADPSASHTQRTEHQELMERALAQLAPELRAVFVLREIEGLSYREIASALQIEPGTVGSRLNQARELLRKGLVELGWSPQE
jgi:RNA polymerase sigma-70 factor (ECF subfamily)